MLTSGVVRFWEAEDGWGVIDSPDTPGGCWAHFSGLVGFGNAHAGQEVTFDFEAVAQDGFRFRATEVRAEGGVPSWPTVVVAGPSDAYRSTLTFEFDDPDESGES